MNKYFRSFVSAIFLSLIFVMFFSNIGFFIKLFYNESVNKKIYDVDYNNVENSFREGMTFHNPMVNLYGIFQKAIDHTIVGNFEYVADDNGILHMINDYVPYPKEDFVDELLKLQKAAEEKSIPLVYVQVPNREISCSNETIKDFNIDDETSDYIVNNLNKNAFSVLDLRDSLTDNSVYKSFELSDLYFHTDLHMQTDAEIWMAAQVADYLEYNHNLTVDNKEYLTDMENYTKNSYEFIGNYGRTYGDYFVKSDTFDIYHPVFPTNCSITVPDAPEIERQGSFEDVMLNGYEDNTYDKHTYWVTNYGQFTHPYYKYKNCNNADGLKILIFSDSTCYRAWSYLLLTVGEVTILDPRYFNETDYFNIAMTENEFDVILVWQENHLDGTKLLFD